MAIAQQYCPPCRCPPPYCPPRQCPPTYCPPTTCPPTGIWKSVTPNKTHDNQPNGPHIRPDLQLPILCLIFTINILFN